MRHRIFVDAITPPEVTVSGEEFHHSVRVVRVRAGEEVELFDRAGNAAEGIVDRLDREHAVIVIGDPLPSRESSLAITLAMAVIQLEKFELVLQKGTELGVRTFIPLVTDRVELRPERYANKRERWERIVFEAVKQSGRTAIPNIEEPREFTDVLREPGTKILFDADAEPSTVGVQNTITLLIGPEGGWSEEELQSARDAGCLFQRLGPRRLRAETAAIAATAVMASRCGDL
jgi:16S rRNA (uracil1498-N3)-methyltransferase